ncbi:glycosyltransferase [Pseudooceanicola algae]|uniref:Glycosyltransferase 2-like domain-containing protein n=1 Tax=Pseudooceanicola algae TaxID=1537215 RepID=A0A418SGR3_9RHOB|nr:glycosyltransferase [Pseudooceanicola algae]QPM90305.1 hypothetical protein PSAL_015400 [Pseudooceanicola algae]QPM90546.1 hypothetical protein PSAL_017850 [Pseudooceanicola algae]
MADTASPKDTATPETAAPEAIAAPEGAGSEGTTGSESADAADNRDQIAFHSVDSAPKRFAVFVPQWKGLAVLGLFCLVSTLLLWLKSAYLTNSIFPHHDLVVTQFAGNHSIAVRIFVISFYIAFSAFAAASLLGRVLFALDLLLTYAVLCAAFDMTGALAAWSLDLTYSLHFVEIVSGITGFAVYSFKLMERGHMPSRIPVEHRPKQMRRAFLRLGFALILAGGLSIWVGGMDLEIVKWMREVTLLGGIGPGVFLFLPVCFFTLYGFALWDDWRQRHRVFAPDISVIVPAHNEEYIIERTIQGLDRAAANYAGQVHILIMENNSTDDTAAIAARALAACESATGRVIPVPTPGKSNALNAGLDAAETEFLVRVDADTVLGQDNLTRAMQHFADPAVGTVGGVPIPPGGALFDRPRLLEVLVKHGFYSVAFSAVESVVGIPGMFVVYRTEHPRYLGGFVEGMNGEDTDISLRIGELGFHSVVDPKIRYVSEVPATYGHMREQRMRWFRSVYHVSSRCRDLIYSDWPTLRGKVLLPFMLVNSGRRAMLVPLILFGVIEYAGGFNPGSPLAWQAVVAVMIGAPAMMAVVAALFNGMPKAILNLPHYLLFRILRAYFTLESMLSISIRTNREDIARAYLRNIIPDKPVRVA